jgi:hypothetical protein
VKAETRTLQGVLHGDRRFVIPVYQRPYVWTQEKQWEPLWQDIEATVQRLGEARVAGAQRGLDAAKADDGAPPHFLGAIVIEQSPTKTGDVETRLVVDGQQRLTTIQLMLRGVLDALDEVDSSKQLRAKLRKALLNDPEVVSKDQLYKLEPRPAERGEYLAAMDHGQPGADGGSKFAAARMFFKSEAKDFLLHANVPADPYGEGHRDEHRAALLVATLLGLVKLVVIDLEEVDDAQVIFEALNARNTPLTATDLVKNLLFMRAQAQHHDPQALYDTSWKRFDDHAEWWQEPVGVGHAQRARQDWLLGDWLIAQRGRVISVGRLYGEFRGWLDASGTKPYDALVTLNSYADAYEALNGRRSGASAAELTAYSHIERLNITVATPVLLWLLVQPTDVLGPVEREKAFRAIESYVVRRMAAKYQTRAYGQVFGDVLKAAQAATGDPGRAVVEALRGSPQGYVWPSDDEIRAAFADGRYYGPGGVNQDRLRLILGAIDRRLHAQAMKTEQVDMSYDGLQIEHVIPQSWRTTWKVETSDEASQILAEQDRERHVNRIGNLTLVTGPLNIGLSNDPWAAKRAALAEHSILRLNSLLVAEPDWHEERIDERSEWLADELSLVWAGPGAPDWS